jgi:hypothetical protein
MGAPERPTLPADGVAREPLGRVLQQLTIVLQQQADELSAEDFDGLDRLDAERERLGTSLGQYTPADVAPQDRALLEQVSALDQRLLALGRESLDRTARELGDVRRGRGALNEYRRRGQNLIYNLGQLDAER